MDKARLRVVLVEDSPDDAEIIVRRLERGGFELTWQRVETEGDLVAALATLPDAVISDWAMPKITAFRALELVRARSPELPFLLVSGTVGEETAVEAMKRGANDYLLKDRLDRLPVAVRQALETAALRREHREAHERFDLLAKHVGEVFWIVSPDRTQVFFASPAFEGIWGLSCAELYATPRLWTDSVHPDDREMAHGNPDVPEKVFRIVRPDGGIRWIRSRAFPVPDDGGGVARIAGVATDITKQRELEQQFQQAQRFESIGQLAGGVAHDFNNLLSVIITNAYMLQDLALPPESKELIDDILSVSERATSLTRQLLVYGRRQTVQAAPLDLDELVTDMTRMLERIVGEDVKLVRASSREPIIVLADSSMLQQVVLNLAVNARDAMPSGGELAIETEIVGDEACLRLRDTGSGITDEVRLHIFEPFFTTKERGRGTGLGLATVHSIVAQHHGRIEVASTVGVGTEMAIFLPLQAEEPVNVRRSSSAIHSRGGSETVLVVEDDALVRKATMRVLRKQGYTVLEAESGPHALEVWRAHKDAVGLVLTDLVMPGGMSGIELGRIVKDEAPGLEVIYTSGYSPDLAGKELAPEERFLPKPIDNRELVRMVRECLDAPRGRS